MASPPTVDDVVDPLVPLGIRLAVRPIRPDAEHEKTYDTAAVEEATNISRDGRVDTIQDGVERERED